MGAIRFQQHADGGTSAGDDLMHLIMILPFSHSPSAIKPSPAMRTARHQHGGRQNAYAAVCRRWSGYQEQTIQMPHRDFKTVFFQLEGISVRLLHAVHDISATIGIIAGGDLPVIRSMKTGDLDTTETNDTHAHAGYT